MRTQFEKTPSEGGKICSRRSLVLIGAPVLACIAGFAWYFAGSHRPVPRGHEEALTATPPRASTNPGTSVVPSQERQNPKDGLGYVWIPPGKFIMGCSPGDGKCDNDEKPPHEVTITHGFWLGKTEVTLAAYNWFRKVMRKGNPSVGNPDLPLVDVSWEEACESVHTGAFETVGIGNGGRVGSLAGNLASPG